jgi:hypothetical protein
MLVDPVVLGREEQQFDPRNIDGEKKAHKHNLLL